MADDPFLRQLGAADAGQGGDAVGQAVEQGGRRAFFVAADVAADVGQIQHFAGAEQGFEKQIAVVVAAGAVARARAAGD